MRNTSKMKLSLLCASVSLSHLACKNRNFGEVKLIGGSRSGAENYPALTRIKINGKTHCTAGKVGENLFITAAHCVTQAGFRQGVYYGQKISDAFAPGAVLTLQDIKGHSTQATVVATHPHPAFHWAFRNIDNWGADVALFSVKEKTPQLAIAQVEFSKMPNGQQITIGGFGCQEGSLTDEGSENEIRIDEQQKIIDRSALLKQGSKELQDTTYGRLSNDARLWADEAFLATGSALIAKTGSSALCPGDSGGPAFVKTPSGAKIIGINSGMGLNDELANDKGIPAYSLHTRLNSGGLYAVGDWIQTIQTQAMAKTAILAQGQVNVSPESATAGIEVTVAPQSISTLQVRAVPLYQSSSTARVEEIIFRGSSGSEIKFTRTGDSWQAGQPLRERGLLQFTFSAQNKTDLVLLITSSANEKK